MHVSGQNRFRQSGGEFCRRVPVVAHLPSELQLRLKGHVQVFIAEKPFVGCRGQRITDEVRVTNDVGNSPGIWRWVHWRVGNI